MRNLLITISYNGSRYHGFQVQKNTISVCQVFQDSVERVFGSRLDVKGCSRTDTGVHASAYCLSMKTDSGIPCDKAVQALNANLPGDIAVKACREVPLAFHARYSCRGKRYLYKLHNSRIPDPFSQGLAYQYSRYVDEQLLHRQAQDFLGKHDFTAFSSIKGTVENKVRTISSFSVSREGEKVLFVVTGDGFLYNMVRIMVGTLLFIGEGKIQQDAIPRILESRNRGMAGKTIPAMGLYLEQVFYREADLLL